MAPHGRELRDQQEEHIIDACEGHDDVADLDEDATPDEVVANEEKKKAAAQKVLDDIAAAAAVDDDEGICTDHIGPDEREEDD